VGKWLPEDHQVIHDWLKKLVDHVTANPLSLLPVIKEFKELIEGDAQIYMLFHQMFNEVPHKPPYNKDPTGKPQVPNYEVMLLCFNYIMTHAPNFDESGVVGFPINAILDWPMGTPSGFAAFLNDKVNAQFCKMLKQWATFLRSPDSRSVLNTTANTGWFSAQAMTEMPDFIKDFVCDPTAPYYGFTSWDNFFTRQFRAGIRPVVAPDDDNIIANACEAAPYCVKSNVKAKDRFWIKGQPYSLNHMLAGDELAPQFVGGTVYQAFLSAVSYHRWHSPVNGKVVKTYVQQGTYYSETPAEGFDPAAPNDSQGYITEVATRRLIFIQADNPNIGLMCFMAVGMAEVSSCEITFPNASLTKGQEIGMFHYGGSTHCLLFRPGVNLTFNFHGQTPGLKASNIPVNTDIASVTS
jgi:phosphatidylserine decarboxylase